jgi:hypothetical protein
LYTRVYTRMSKKRNHFDTRIEHDDMDVENTLTVRAKWILDGASSIDEVIAKLEGEIEYYKRMKADRWELTGTIDDDWGFLIQVAPDEEMTDSKRNRTTETSSVPGHFGEQIEAPHDTHGRNEPQ